jgi:HEPN domain-containing protein
VATFHCQQAAEKLLKGFLVQAGTDFGKTHDLDALAQSVLAHFPSLESLLRPMRAWTAWSVAYRYPGEPGPEPEPSTEELSQALDMSERLDTALRSLAPPD